MLEIENKIRELNTDGMCAYILQEPESYYVTAYKAMKNDMSGIFLDCHLVRHNGAPKFVYFTENMYSIEEFIIRNSVRDIAEAIYGLARTIAKVNENGFLSIVCVDTRLSRIFWDKTNHKAKLIYLPIKAPADVNQKRDCEVDLCRSLAEALQDKSGDPEIQRIRQNLQKGMIANLNTESVNDSADSTMGNTASFPGRKTTVELGVYNTVGLYHAMTGTLPTQNRVILRTVSGQEIFSINRSEFVIGKSMQKADGVLENPAVSRQHCKIQLLDNGTVGVMDLGSSNGTFVNGERVLPNQITYLNNGTKLKIANQEFLVEIV